MKNLKSPETMFCQKIQRCPRSHNGNQLVSYDPWLTSIENFAVCFSPKPQHHQVGVFFTVKINRSCPMTDMLQTLCEQGPIAAFFKWCPVNHIALVSFCHFLIFCSVAFSSKHFDNCFCLIFPLLEVHDINVIVGRSHCEEQDC